jgi:plastocyanin
MTPYSLRLRLQWLSLFCFGAIATGLFLVTAQTSHAQSTTITTPPVPECGRLAGGGVLTPGQSIVSCTGGYSLNHQTDGNVTLTRKVGTGATTTLWSTNTAGTSTTRLAVFKNGGLVLSGPNNTLVWRSNDFAGALSTNANLTLGNDGSLVITDGSGKTLWFAGCGFLPTGSSILKGKSLVSCNKSHTLNLQPDGNLVLYPLTETGATGTPIWNTETQGQDNRRLTVTTADNLVLIDATAKRTWQAFPIRAPKTIEGLLLRPDGSLFLRSKDRTVAWTADKTQLGRSNSESVTKLNKEDPWTWLIKSVCVDSTDKVVKADPYTGCPPNTAIRKIRTNEPLPYWNFDQFSQQRHDAFPYQDPRTGTTIAVMPFDFEPHGTYNLADASDGYDIYGVQNGLVSGFNTQDGGGYSTTFFGANCTVGDGWIFFPSSGFLNAGSRTDQISGVYWQQAGQSFPGNCPTGYGDSGTSWEVKNYTFGGKNGSRQKTMETILSIHGFQDTEQFRTQGHLEVFYFTREYGITRWEVWKPVQQNIPSTTACNDVGNRTYNGVEFNVSACRDWSNVVMPTSASIPVWPIPNFNVLKASHFDDAFNQHWFRGGNSPAGNIINWSLKNSTSDYDRKYASAGVRYLVTNCGAGADGQCGAPNTQIIWQDVGVEQFGNGWNYGYGANLRLEPGQSGTGKMRIGIQMIDGAGKVLWARWKDAEVTSDNGNNTPADVKSSVYRTSKFVYGLEKMDIKPGTTKVRFVFSPLTAHTFEIVNAWLAPWPKATTGFGTLAFEEADDSILTSASATTDVDMLGQLSNALSALRSALGSWLGW